VAKFAASVERPKAVSASEGFAPDPLTKGSAHGLCCGSAFRSHYRLALGARHGLIDPLYQILNTPLNTDALAATYL